MLKVDLTPNKNLFLIFLLINAAGYDYENNPKGKNKVRMNFRKKIQKLANQHPEIQNFLETIQETEMSSNEYIRLANLIMSPKYSINLPEDIIHQIKYQFNNISGLEVLDDLFQEYNTEVEIILGNFKKDCFINEIHKVLSFFNLSEDIEVNLQIHLNLLESYCRGTNYFNGDNQIISASLGLDEEISWRTIRHEFMHILIKKIFKNNLKNRPIEIPVDQNYLQDSVRTKFEENFILAANLFFINEQKKRDSNLKYFYDRGYKKIKEFYLLIEEYFVKSKSRLSNEVLDEFVSRIFVY